jgi:hypothetical protein
VRFLDELSRIREETKQKFTGSPLRQQGNKAASQKDACKNFSAGEMKTSHVAYVRSSARLGYPRMERARKKKIFWSAQKRKEKKNGEVKL